MNRVIAYIRVSSDRQAQSGLGVEAQLEAIEKAIGTPSTVFTDEGISGSRPDRPGLLAALDSLKRGDVLAVAKRDRLARGDVLLMGWIEKEVKRTGAKIQSAAGEGTEGDDPANILMRRVVDAFAEYERLMGGLRTKAALAQVREKGRKTGGTIPFGFDVDTTGSLQPRPEEMEVLLLMRELRASGATFQAICDELENGGFKTKQGGTKWYPTTVRQILNGKQHKTAA